MDEPPPTIDELFARWQQAAGARSPEELCAPWSHLLPQLHDRIAAAAARPTIAAPDAVLDPTPAPAIKAEPIDFDALLDSAARLPVIKGYTVLKRIGEGGQGVVYQAIQHAPRRKVAIKVLLNSPYAARSARHRFEREIELVATLRHPHIVAVFDSGVTADGHLYYAMDYVRGLPITTFVQQNKLPLEKALALFSIVCEAVNHAHQKGVMHRDLKPANILVDDAGNVRILDFGLAKQIAEAPDTLVSVTGQLMGTLPYMSPEQTRGNPDLVDIRTDVYALGVILYELLTGQYPYPVIGGMAEILSHIANTLPKPLTRTWTLEQGVARSSRRRHAACPIDDEVETIAMKALSKDRERRYQSAGEFGRDLQHYLHDEPIEAKRDSAIYLLRRTLYRYRAAAASFLLFMLLLLVSSIALWILHNQANAQRDIAREALIQAAHDRDLAQTAADRYRKELQTTDALTLTSLGLNPTDFNPRRSTTDEGFLGDVVILERPEFKEPAAPVIDYPAELATLPAYMVQYPVSSISIDYPRPDPANPPLADLLNLSLSFAVQDNALTPPHQGLPTLQLKLSDIGKQGPHAITLATLVQLYVQIAHFFNDRGIEAVFVAADQKDISQLGRDLRPPGSSVLHLQITLGYVTDVQTILWDGGFRTPEERVNLPEYDQIRNHSPIKPFAQGGPDILDVKALKDYVSRASRADDGPGNIVAVARITDNPGELSLQYYIVNTIPGRSHVPPPALVQAYRRVFLAPVLDDHGNPMRAKNGQPLRSFNTEKIRNVFGYAWQAYTRERGNKADIPGFPAWLAQQPPPDPTAPLARATIDDLRIIVHELQGQPIPGSDSQAAINSYLSPLRPPNISEADFRQLFLPAPAPAP